MTIRYRHILIPKLERAIRELAQASGDADGRMNRKLLAFLKATVEEYRVSAPVRGQPDTRFPHKF